MSRSPDILLAAIRKGVEMRDAQKRYFKERTQTNLVASKLIEREFDRIASQALDGEPRPGELKV